MIVSGTAIVIVLFLHVNFVSVESSLPLLAARAVRERVEKREAGGEWCDAQKAGPCLSNERLTAVGGGRMRDRESREGSGRSEAWQKQRGRRQLSSRERGELFVVGGSGAEI